MQLGPVQGKFEPPSFLPIKIPIPATPAARRRSNGQLPTDGPGAESGRRHGLHPVCTRLPAVALVPATTCLSVEPSRIVTIPALVSTCECEHSASTVKLSACEMSATKVALLDRRGHARAGRRRAHASAVTRRPPPNPPNSPAKTA